MFWQKWGPNHFEVLALGVAGGVALTQRVGAGLVLTIAVIVAIASYGVRHFVRA